jgi:hypothetical protein
LQINAPPQTRNCCRGGASFSKAAGEPANYFDTAPSWDTTAVFNASSDKGNAYGYPTWNGLAGNSQSNANQDDDDQGLEEQ